MKSQVIIFLIFTSLPLVSGIGYDKEGNYKRGKEIGKVERSSGGRTCATVEFKVQREPYNTFSITGKQQFEQRKTAFKITIEPTGDIH